MTRLRRASVIAALCLLAWAATGSAECAWIVWRNSVDGTGKDNWVPVQAAGSRQECGTITDSKTKFEDYAREQYRAAGRTLHGEWSFLCLPDTVDPRGPKENRQ